MALRVLLEDSPQLSCDGLLPLKRRSSFQAGGLNEHLAVYQHIDIETLIVTIVGSWELIVGSFNRVDISGDALRCLNAIDVVSKTGTKCKVQPLAELYP